MTLRRPHFSAAHAAPRPFSMRRRTSQRGAAALILATMVALATGSLMLLSHVNRQSDRHGGALQERREAAAWAREALINYMQVRGRLPCVATTVGGAEDCSAGSKGYLPVGELLTTGQGGESRFGRLPLVYVVYRGGNGTGDADFATTSESFSPLRFDATPISSYTPQLSGFDLCARLGQMSPGPSALHDDMGDRSAIPARTDRAHLVSTAAANRGIVFAVAAQGEASPSALVSDFDNAALPDPASAADQEQASAIPVDYADARTLFSRLRCGTALASANLVASAQDLSKLSASQRAANSDAAVNAIISQHGFVLSGLAGVASARVDIAAANVTILKNAAKLPDNPPLHIMGLTQGEWSLRIGQVDLARSIIGSALDEAYWLSYLGATIAAKTLPYWRTPTEVLTQADKAGIGNEP